MESRNLWGNLPLDASIRTPLVLLREQATILTKLTNAILEGQVDTESTTKKFIAVLKIIAPALGGYSLSVIHVSYPIFAYPASVTDYQTGVQYICNSEEECLKAIENILSSEKIHKMIGALISQSKSENNFS